MFLEKIDVETIMPCNAHPERIKVIAKTSADLADLMPYLVTVLRQKVKSVLYNRAAGTVTFKIDRHIFTVHGRKVAITYLEDLDQANKFFTWCQEVVNETEVMKEGIEPTLESNKPLTPLDIYKYLPKTNCRRCGDATCLAFATKISRQDASIEKCGVLKEDNFQEAREKLLSILEEAGYGLEEEA